MLPRFSARSAPVSMVDTVAAARTAVAAEAPAVIVIDPDLPDADGTTFIRDVRSSHSWVQVFVISGDGWSHRMPQFIAAGATDVAIKPFDAGKLPGRVEALLRASETAHNEMLYRQQLESRLQHLGRVATLGTLSATIAHEIANPLTLISADVESAMEIVDGDTAISRPQQEELREIVREIRVAAGIIQNLAQRIRTFSRRDEPNRVTESLIPSSIRRCYS